MAATPKPTPVITPKPPAFNPTQAFGSGGLTVNSSPGPSASMPAGPGLGYYGSKDKYNSNILETFEKVSTPTTSGGSPRPTPVPTPQQPQQQNAPQQPNFDQQISDIFNPQMDYLNQAENNLNSQFPSVLAELDAQQKTSSAQLDANKVSANQTLDTNLQQGARRKEDANSTQRRIFNEQRMGAQQRFGGVSSAGEAANTLLGLEQQRQAGSINRDFNDYAHEIEQHRAQVENDYKSQVLQLQQTTQQAKNEATRDFQNKLLQITSNRTQLTTEKAKARLDALMDLRNKTFAIDQQNLQFQQTLEAQRSQANIAIEQYKSTSGGQAKDGQAALDRYNTIQYNNGLSGEPNKPFQLNQPAYIGAIGKSIVGRDEQGRNIYSDGTRGYTQYQ